MAGAGVIHRRLVNLPATARSLDEDLTRVSRCEDLDSKHNRRAFSGQQGRLFEVRADIGSPLCLEYRGRNEMSQISGFKIERSPQKSAARWVDLLRSERFA